MSRPTKKPNTQKVVFSDSEIQEEIKDQIKQIREKNLKHVEEQQKIFDLYKLHKQEKRKRKMLEKDTSRNKVSAINIAALNAKDSSEDDEQGQINQKKPIKNETNENAFEGVPSISNLGDHIRPLTLTRNKIVDLLNSRRFEELVKGCFVRYLIDSNASSNSNSYIIAQIVGVAEGNKQYTVQNVKTKVLLKLQETSQNVVTLSLQLISNQHPPGGLQIEKWLQTNRNKIPKEKQLKEKLQEHKKLLVEQISSSQIDTNIWKKAKKTAQSTEEPKEDITNLIDFVTEKMHNLDVQIEEKLIGRKPVEGDINIMTRQRQQTNNILQKLKVIRQKYIKSRSDKKGQLLKKQKKYSWNMSEEKRNDAINEKCKARFIMLATYEGCNKLKNHILENHMKYNFELD